MTRIPYQWHLVFSLWTYCRLRLQKGSAPSIKMFPLRRCVLEDVTDWQTAESGGHPPNKLVGFVTYRVRFIRGPFIPLFGWKLPPPTNLSPEPLTSQGPLHTRPFTECLQKSRGWRRKKVVSAPPTTELETFMKQALSASMTIVVGSIHCCIPVREQLAPPVSSSEVLLAALEEHGYPKTIKRSFPDTGERPCPYKPLPVTTFIGCYFFWIMMNPVQQLVLHLV